VTDDAARTPIFDAPARLAHGRSRRVVFVAAGALGGSVADRLDSSGGDERKMERSRGR
jgi:hypothetical protein